MTSLKGILLFIKLLAVLAIPIGSCDYDPAHQGYPQNVTIPKAGGSVTISGNTYLISIAIQDSEGNGEKVDIDWNFDENHLIFEPIQVSYQRLTVNTLTDYETLELTAEPSSQEKRELSVIVSWSGSDHSVIKVIQKGK